MTPLIPNHKLKSTEMELFIMTTDLLTSDHDLPTWCQHKRWLNGAAKKLNHNLHEDCCKNMLSLPLLCMHNIHHAELSQKHNFKMYSQVKAPLNFSHLHLIFLCTTTTTPPSKYTLWKVCNRNNNFWHYKQLWYI